MPENARGFELEVLIVFPETGEKDLYRVGLRWEPPFPEEEEEVQATAEHLLYYLLGCELGNSGWAIFSHRFEEVNLLDVEADLVLRITEHGFTFTDPTEEP